MSAVTPFFLRRHRWLGIRRSSDGTAIGVNMMQLANIATGLSPLSLRQDMVSLPLESRSNACINLCGSSMHCRQ